MNCEDKESQSQPVATSTPCDESSAGTSVAVAAIPVSGNVFSTVSLAQATTPTPSLSNVAVSSQVLPPLSLSQATSQNMAIHPHLSSVAPSQLPQVQVIQQPLHNQAYLQQLYAPPQQMLLPGNLTLQPAGIAPTLQSLGAAPGISLQLQSKATLDPKTSGPALIPANPLQGGVNFSSPNIVSATGQVIATGAAKTCVQGQMLTAASKSTAVIQGQSGFVPSTTSQTVVIGQLGVLSNQPSILPSSARPQLDNQKGKPFFLNQQAALQPKSPILPSPAATGAATAQMLTNTQLKHLTSTPQLITSQAPATMIASQAQIIGSLQALGASLPQGITWATPGALQSPTLLTQNPIFIRSQQSDMFIQSPPPPHTATATLHAVQAPPTPAHPPPAPTPLPIIKQRQVRPATSVSTQTAVSTSTTTHINVTTTTTTMSKAQGKQRPRIQNNRSPLASNAVQASLVTATTQTQTHLPQHLKADAANQTKPTPEMRSTATQSKGTVTELKPLLPKPDPSVVVHSVAPRTATTITMDAGTTMASLCIKDKENEVKVKAIPKAMSSTVAPTSTTTTTSTTTNTDGRPLEEKKKNTQVGPDTSLPLPDTSVKEKQPQKAIVKPHVLTHVIEGFVIQEGPEPFPIHRVFLKQVNRSNTTETSPQKSIQQEKAIDAEPPVQAQKEKRKKLPKVRGPVELAKCEICGKIGPKSKFKRSKRFCSNTCAKRYNVGCSKRHNQYPAGEQETAAPGQETNVSPLKPNQDYKRIGGPPAKKKKMGFKRKGWRKAQKLKYKASEWQPQDDVPVKETINEPEIESEESVKAEAEVEVAGETTDTPSCPESSMSPTTPSSNREEMEVDMPETIPELSAKTPLKWTVQDVVEYVRSLSGCVDYADEFRSQEIDGQALLLLKEDHLMTTMNMKLGPALKICAGINSLKEEINR